MPKKGFKQSKETLKKKADARSWYKHHSEETKRKISERLKGQRHSKKTEFKKGHKGLNWHGGRHVRDGYVYIFKPEHPNAIYTYIAEHRFIVEKEIGRFLKSHEVIHHLNNIRSDNRKENLMAFNSHSAHRRFECGRDVKSEEIIFDGR